MRTVISQLAMTLRYAQYRRSCRIGNARMTFTVSCGCFFGGYFVQINAIYGPS